MKKFSTEEVIKLFSDAPDIAPELISEIYITLEEGGVEAVNDLFATKGTFNPDFKDKSAVIDFIVLMKKFSLMELTVKEEAVFNMRLNKN
jgi:hypothetical protein